MSTSIKGFCLHGSEKIKPATATDLSLNTNIVEMEVPELKEGELLAKTLYTGICGSDNSATLGKPNFDWVERPRIIGHEFSAEVLELGPGDHGDIKVGDVFTPLAMLGCQDEECPACSVAKWNLCPSKQIIGFHRNGGFGQRVVLETDRVVQLMEGLTPQQGALVEPLSIIVNALHNKCAIKPGQDVVVTGCGIIGLMSAELARAAGARVAITGIAQDRGVRLKKAKERGFIALEVGPENTLSQQLSKGVKDAKGIAFGNNGKVDLLIECSGVPQVLTEAISVVRPEGDICVIATYPTAVEINATHLTRTSLNMRGSMGSCREDYMVAQKLMVTGVFPSEHYTNFYDFENITQAFEDAIRAKNVKAVIKMN
ncbi:zinc-dependent alcohol dehydrogenase [Muriicola sp. Z0-33]|uniref:zinc-dependent alcohol dehydrogenase n=1 Tax=Muriicola sp. Z0-33 TaxID=2816957 RepID=UPI002238A417|nr:alcohol dehydrogenase catalytic domain-containing protein [Muriicola sp. Z0-33]MCW5516875.1 alcohol dehydrogenase catalytic domain-containing protein [Muriicola sp. Z0-33]